MLRVACLGGSVPIRIRNHFTGSAHCYHGSGPNEAAQQYCVVSACHISFSLYVSKTVSAIQVPLSLNLCQQQLVNWKTFVIKRHVRGTILQIPDRLQPLVHLITTVIRENILHFNEQMLAYRFAFNPNIYM